jgi:hypothetical protein
VYRARDTKLNRDVAIKVLLPDVANDPERLARFRREAQVLASLTHPHIAQIYGLEDSDGVKALVMELVEGPTLADLIARGQPPPASGQGGRWQISNNGGVLPRWSRSGRELVYQSGDQIMAARYTVNGDTFVAEKPRVWIAKSGAAVIPNNVTWDLAPDGTRVAVVAPVDSAQASTQDHQVVFLMNFFDELRRRRRPVPAIRSTLLDNLFTRVNKCLNLASQGQNFIARRFAEVPVVARLPLLKGTG